MQRRKLLMGTGSVLMVALAGCSGSDDDDDVGEADTGGTDDDGETSDDGDDDNGEGDGPDPDEVLEDDERESTREGLEFVEHGLVEDDFSVSVEGVVVNNTGEEQSYVEVGVVFYNADGQRIDDSFTNTTDLPDGEEWVFDVMTTEDAEDIDHYNIVVTDSAF